MLNCNVRAKNERRLQLDRSDKYHPSSILFFTNASLRILGLIVHGKEAGKILKIALQ